MPTLDANNNIVVTAEDLREVFPEFSAATYSDAQLELYITLAANYISTLDSGLTLSFNQRVYALELMSAHLLMIGTQNTANNTSGGGTTGGVGGQIIHAQIGSVSVSAAVPPNKTQLQYWLNSTPYGMQYYALLSANVTPLIYGGSFQRVL